MRRPSAFKKTDVTRATKAILAAGLEVSRVEIGTDGSIIVVPEKLSRGPRDQRELCPNSEASFSEAPHDSSARSARPRPAR
jgi:hypothetical protein